jgi:hypothetical protein
VKVKDQLLKRNNPSDGKLSSVSFVAFDFINWQHIALSQLFFIFFAEENKLIEKISAIK